MYTQPLPHQTQPTDVFATLRWLPGCVWLDSSLRHATLGRYSYLAADPYRWLTCPAETDGLSLLSNALTGIEASCDPALPPLQGGAIGWFGYDLARSLERLPSAAYDEFAPPGMAVGLYDVVFAFDHQTSQGWIISQGCPAHGAERPRRAQARAEYFLNLLEGEGPPECPAVPPAAQRATLLAPQHPLPGYDAVTSDFSRTDYLAAVARAVEYIYAGDIFQVNLSQRLITPLREPAWQYYLRLRETSPAPFSAYFDSQVLQLASASPERFLRVCDRRVETRPIKGTRPRAGSHYADAASATQLAASEKDRAENTMIVDLLRNDLSRVCLDASVRAPVLCGLETYAQVHHLVSVVEGELRGGLSPADLLRAAFPGGSITGAPKVRAMEIIAELEPTCRGPYCGALGYIGFNGEMDSSILIRTAIASGGWLQMPVGGGVVADSDPAAEYEETLHKAAGMLAALPST